MLLISCSIQNDSEKSNKNTISKLKTDYDILHEGVQFYKTIGSQKKDLGFISMLIENKCYAQALFLLEESQQFLKPDYNFWRMYFEAALGGHHFEKIWNVPVDFISSKSENQLIFEAAKTIIKLNNVIKDNPFDDVAYLKRGEAFLVLNENIAAEWDFNKSLECNQNSFNALYSLLMLWYTSEKYDDALALINRNINQNDNHSNNDRQILEAMGEGLRQLSEIEQDSLLNEIQKRISKAKIHNKYNHNSMALMEINKALTIDDKCAEAYAFRSFVYFGMNEHDLALLDIKQAEMLSGKKKSQLHSLIEQEIKKR